MENIGIKNDKHKYTYYNKMTRSIVEIISTEC